MGEGRDNIGNVLSQIETLLAPPPKVFPDVKSFCDNLRVCIGTSIIMDLATCECEWAAGFPHIASCVVRALLCVPAPGFPHNGESGFPSTIDKFGLPHIKDEPLELLPQ